jgi:hypothetical protein
VLAGVSLAASGIQISQTVMATCSFQPYTHPSQPLLIQSDPKELPEKATWYLATNLPAPGSKRATEGKLEAADLAEIVRLYGLRMWVEQSYKQVRHVLGWSGCQVRSDLAIRRHWQLVCCAFSFCWWAYGHLPTDEEPAQTRNDDPPSEPGRRGEKETQGVLLARDPKSGKGMAGAMDNAQEILAGVLQGAPPRELRTLLEQVFSDRGLYLYVR